MLHVDIAGGDEGVDTWEFGILDSFPACLIWFSGIVSEDDDGRGRRTKTMRMRGRVYIL